MLQFSLILCIKIRSMPFVLIFCLCITSLITIIAWHNRRKSLKGLKIKILNPCSIVLSDIAHLQFVRLFLFYPCVGKMPNALITNLFPLGTVHFFI